MGVTIRFRMMVWAFIFLFYTLLEILQGEKENSKVNKQIKNTYITMNRNQYF